MERRASPPRDGRRVEDPASTSATIARPVLTPNTPELAPLRGKDPVSGWIRQFARRDPERSQRYLQALSIFLGYPGEGQPDWTRDHYAAVRSPTTRRAYQFALAEFFEWLARSHERIVAPHEVSREDAFRYAEWLGSRGKPPFDYSLEAEKLKDGDRADDLSIYEIVQKRSRARLSEVARELPRALRREHPAEGEQQATELVSEAWLHERLTRLVAERVLVRSPTMTTLREEDPRAGRDRDEPINPDVYLYTCPAVLPCARSTIALRLSALSSFWRILQRGENTGPKALLDYNVFEDALERVTKGLSAEKKVSSLERRPTADLIERVLAEAEGTHLTHKRNVALLWFLLLTGARITETLRLRRAEPPARDRQRYPGWLDMSTSPPVVVLIRKGGKPQRLPLPAPVLVALGVFWSELAKRVPEGVRQADPGYRYKLLLREPDAPLFPPLTLWGKNVPGPEGPDGPWQYRKAMRRQAVQMMLCRLSKKAGLSERERLRLHPHGFRHTAATAMLKGGKNPRDVQAILGHSSIVTTEIYLEDVTELVRLCGVADILDWLARHGVRPPKADRPPERPAPPEIIEAKAVEVPETPPRALPAHDLPAGVAPPPAPTTGLQSLGVPPERALLAIGPEERVATTLPYEEMAEGRKPTDLVWSSRPQARFVEEHYPRLPPGFGIGKESLLVWVQKDAPLPWPVLAPVQAYPERGHEGTLLERLEGLYDEWLAEAPSRAIALALWLQYLGMVTIGLEQKIAGGYLWVPFDTPARIDRELRAHEEDWLYRWFRENAHTFRAAQRKFRGIPRPEPAESRADYLDRIRLDMQIAGSIPAPGEVPEWMFEKDPVRAIYDRSPEEWRAFCRWLGRLTGVDPSELRNEIREEQLSFFEERESAGKKRSRAMIEEFYSLVDETRDPRLGDSERRRVSDQMRRLRDHVKREFQIDLPSEAPHDEHKRRSRIDELVEKRYPAARPAAAQNVLQSQLFEARAFRINSEGKTIEHTAAFREEFQRDHLQDSECVMRRVARALWERVKEFEWKGAARSGRSRMTETEERRWLFVAMLAQMAYILPCPPEMEAAMRDAGYPSASPSRVAEVIRRRATDLLAGKAPADDLDDATEALLAIVSPSDPEMLEKLHQREEGRAERRRGGLHDERVEKAEREQVRRRKKTLRNAFIANRQTPDVSREAVLPHPLRLVAATFWPV